VRPLAVIALLSFGLAHAQPSVVFAPFDDSPALARRLEAELKERGLVLTQQPPLASISIEVMKQVARSSGAVAVIVAQRTSSGIDLWVFDRTTDKLVARTIRDTHEEATVALEVVELLRASLLELESAQFKPAALVPAAVTAIVEQPQATVGRLAVGAFGLLAPGGLSPALGLRARAELTLFERWLLGVDGLFQLTASTVAASGARSDQLLAGALGRLGWQALSSGRLGLQVAVVTGALSITARGSVPAPRVGSTLSFPVFAGGASIDGRVELTRRIALRPSAAVVVLLPRPVITFEGSQVAAWGHPLVMLGLDLEVRAW
jgi:hypothetical protein